jgi:hypothetical protein
MKSIFAGHPLHPPRSVRLLPPLGCERDRARRPHLHTPALPALPQVGVRTNIIFVSLKLIADTGKDQQIVIFFMYRIRILGTLYRRC